MDLVVVIPSENIMKIRYYMKTGLATLRGMLKEFIKMCVKWGFPLEFTEKAFLKPEGCFTDIIIIYLRDYDCYKMIHMFTPLEISHRSHFIQITENAAVLNISEGNWTSPWSVLLQVTCYKTSLGWLILWPWQNLVLQSVSVSNIYAWSTKKLKVHFPVGWGD